MKRYFSGLSHAKRTNIIYFKLLISNSWSKSKIIDQLRIEFQCAPPEGHHFQVVVPGRNFEGKFQVSMPSLVFPAKSKFALETWHRTPCRGPVEPPHMRFDVKFWFDSTLSLHPHILLPRPWMPPAATSTPIDLPNYAEYLQQFIRWGRVSCLLFRSPATKIRVGTGPLP